jgi:hypothetical protein
VLDISPALFISHVVGAVSMKEVVEGRGGHTSELPNDLLASA